ncbi:hypothetical protein DJ71_18565 [Halorubrum sp. E3]|nr:hypothetical protein DJ71_18565 [Halorubrum sp. E3]
MAADESEPGSEPDVADHVEEALPEYLLSSHSDLLLVMEYERRYLRVNFPERECDSCGEEVDHRVEKDTYREIVNTECSNCGHTRTVEYATDGGHELPETLDELVDVAERKETLTCETCGEDVERRWLEDGECVGCREGPGVHAAPRTDGGSPVAEHDPKQDVKQRLELACNLVVSTNADAHLEGVMALILSYRDFIKRNVRRAGGLDGPRFIQWMESATRDPDDFPAPWGAELIMLFDDVLIDVVREGNTQPGVVVRALDEWAEETAEDVTEIHDLPEDFFDVEGDVDG